MPDVVPGQIRVDPGVGDVALVVPEVQFDRVIPAGLVLLSSRTNVLDGVVLDIEDGGELLVL